MAKAITVWQSESGKTFDSKEAAELEDRVSELENALASIPAYDDFEGPCNREIAEWLLANYKLERITP